jgi:hypothetical protein
MPTPHGQTLSIENYNEPHKVYLHFILLDAGKCTQILF